MEDHQDLGRVVIALVPVGDHRQLIKMFKAPVPAHFREIMAALVQAGSHAELGRIVAALEPAEDQQEHMGVVEALVRAKDQGALGSRMVVTSVRTRDFLHLSRVGRRALSEVMLQVARQVAATVRSIRSGQVEVDHSEPLLRVHGTVQGIPSFA